MPTLSWFPMPVYVEKVSGEAKNKIEEKEMTLLPEELLLGLLFLSENYF